MRALRTVAFDADDTLWHNERFFKMTQAHFADLLRDYAAPEDLDQRLMEAERRNLGHYGFGVKGFTLSMIETALDVTDHRAPGHVIREIMEVGRDMLAHPIELLPHVEETVRALAETHYVMVVTKETFCTRNGRSRNRASAICSTRSRSCRTRRRAFTPACSNRCRAVWWAP